MRCNSHAPEIWRHGQYPHPKPICYFLITVCLVQFITNMTFLLKYASYYQYLFDLSDLFVKILSQHLFHLSDLFVKILSQHLFHLSDLFVKILCQYLFHISDLFINILCHDLSDLFVKLLCHYPLDQSDFTLCSNLWKIIPFNTILISF